MIHITNTNSKLGGAILQLNLPAGCTCRADAPCRKLCYACKGNFMFSNVQKSQHDNLTAYLEDKKAFFDYIANYCNMNKACCYFRWHASGDIVDADYLAGVVRVARACRGTKFLIFTKKFDIVNSYLDSHRKPANLSIVFSAWDKSFNVPNPHNLPVTYVNFKDSTQNAEIPTDAIPCTGKCYECLGCWQLKKGQSVVFNQH